MKAERNVYCFGETLLDIIFSEGKPVAAKAGGSMLNTAVSLARCGVRTHIVSEIFSDEPGRMISGFLTDNNVSTDLLEQYKTGATPLALAFLDGEGKAEYSFFKSYPDKRLEREFPAPGKDDIVLFGSIYSITPDIRKSLLQFLSSAKDNGALLFYDPNFRKRPGIELKEVLPLIRENISLSDIVRGSDEDFLHIFAEEEPEAAWSDVRSCGCSNLVYTRSGKDIWVFTVDLQFASPVPRISPVSTVGAGDAFNAGLIFGMIRQGIHRTDLKKLDENHWHALVECGIRFAREVCLSYENYISGDFARSVV